MCEHLKNYVVDYVGKMHGLHSVATVELDGAMANPELVRVSGHFGQEVPLVADCFEARLGVCRVQ